MPSQEKVGSFLILGSNLGDRYYYLKSALENLTEETGLELQSTSGIYETEPVEIKDQPDFLNLAVGISTSLDPSTLLHLIKDIEVSIGRMDRGRWHAREIDIDIIFYDGVVQDSNELTIPHPKTHLRRFVLEPLNEIAAEFVHPVFNKTIGELLSRCPDLSAVRRVADSLVMLPK